MSKNSIPPISQREHRVAERNIVLKALSFYLLELEKGHLKYIDVFNNVVDATIDVYPTQVGAFLRRAKHRVTNYKL